MEIKNKILLYLLLPMIIIGTSYFLITNFFIKRNFDAYVEKESINNTERFTEVVKDQILAQDSVALTSRLFEEKNFGYHVNYIVVFSATGEVLASTFLNERPEELLYLTDQDKDMAGVNYRYLKHSGIKILNVDKPISFGLYNVGYLRFGYDFSAVQSSFLHIFYLYIILGAISLLLVIIFSPWLARFLVKPILQLKQVVEDFSVGDFAKRSGIYTNDEIGQLSISFNQMADKINKSNKELSQEKKNLEKKIAELESWQRATVDREIKMMEYKKMIKDYEEKLRNNK